MAILALATDLKDLRTRLGKMICCYSKKAGNLQVSTGASCCEPLQLVICTQVMGAFVMLVSLSLV